MTIICMIKERVLLLPYQPAPVFFRTAVIQFSRPTDSMCWRFYVTEIPSGYRKLCSIRPVVIVFVDSCKLNRSIQLNNLHVYFSTLNNDYQR